MITRRAWRVAVLLGALTAVAATGLVRPATAAVEVLIGPTPIVNGSARAAGDITVINEKLAFALAVTSPAPYGVPRGALVDLAPVVDGKVGRDRVVFADFIPDHWSAWPNSYQQIDIVERGPERAVIKTRRDWGKVVIETVYQLRSGADHIEIATTMTNGGATPLSALWSGLTLWPNSGFLLSVPGMEGVAEGDATPALAHRVVAYDADWAIALHADYFDHVGDESMDLYQVHTLAPGATRTFEAWLQVLPSGDLGPVVAAEIERRHLESGTVRGAVTGVGDRSVPQPVVVVEKEGKPYAWVLAHDGVYELTLPRGDYTMYATAKSYSDSAKTAIAVAGRSTQVRDFRDLSGPGKVGFVVTETGSGKPLDARIVIAAGAKPPIGFLGRTTFFTELDRKGRVDLSIAPGSYVFEIASGGGFLGPSRRVAVDVGVQPDHAQPNHAGKLARGAELTTVALTRSFDPPAQGWYSADLHHHADQAEAVTPPADLARSQLAAGLDLLFVSDHDSTINHQPLAEIAARRGIPFIAGVELSPSWGHFNAYPLNLGRPLAVDTSVATVDQIIQEARRLGAIVVQANHPFIPYGYLTSVAAGVAPGGFNPNFDLLEVNASAPEDDAKVVSTLWRLWNAGDRYYLAAGTDTHDVWNTVSGHVRTFAHVEGPVSAAAFATALKDGHAYVTHGPLVFPVGTMFGEERRVKPGEPFNLAFDLKSVDGIKSAQLIEAGVRVAERVVTDAPSTLRVDFALGTQHSTWYSLIVEDSRGRKAYTDPIWVDVVDQQAVLPVANVRASTDGHQPMDIN